MVQQFTRVNASAMMERQPMQNQFVQEAIDALKQQQVDPYQAYRY